VTDPEPEPVEEPEPTTEDEPEAPDSEPVGRCEAETVVGGTPYRCALEVMHDGDHSFQPVDGSDNGDASPDIVRASKFNDRVTKYLLKNYTEEYGADAVAELLPCPLCTYSGTWGYVVPVSPPIEVKEAVNQLVGAQRLEDFNDDRDWFFKCQGRVANKELVTCRKCKGEGFMTPEPRAVIPDAPPQLAPVAAGLDAPRDLPPYDSWGTPSWHGDYGKSLEYRTEPVEQWAINLKHITS